MGSAILVVDDEADSADLLGVVLELRLPESSIRVAHGGRAALVMANQLRPDAAVIDLEMPELDGVKVAEALRASFPEAVPLLIALSGNVARLAAISATGTFDHHMSKPTDLEGLIRLLQSI